MSTAVHVDKYGSDWDREAKLRIELDPMSAKQLYTHVHKAVAADCTGALFVVHYALTKNRRFWKPLIKVNRAHRLLRLLRSFACTRQPHEDFDWNVFMVWWSRQPASVAHLIDKTLLALPEYHLMLRRITDTGLISHLWSHMHHRGSGVDTDRVLNLYIAARPLHAYAVHANYLTSTNRIAKYVRLEPWPRARKKIFHQGKEAELLKHHFTHYTAANEQDWEDRPFTDTELRSESEILPHTKWFQRNVVDKLYRNLYIKHPANWTFVVTAVGLPIAIAAVVVTVYG